MFKVMLFRGIWSVIFLPFLKLRLSYHNYNVSFEWDAVLVRNHLELLN